MKKYKRHTDEEKVKIVLEVLREQQTINEIAAKYEVHPQSIHEWKKEFLENATYAMNPSQCFFKLKFCKVLHDFQLGTSV